MKAELGVPSKRGRPLREFFGKNAKQGPPSVTRYSGAKNKIVLAMLDGCVDMVQAAQVAARGTIQTNELRATVQTMSNQRNMINVNTKPGLLLSRR